MPELPEVETVRSVLAPQLCGQSIVSVTVHQPEAVGYPAVEAFAASAAGRTIRELGRRGKFLRIALDSGCIVAHLRMTGRLLVTPRGYAAEKHTHVVVSLANETELRFIDPRRFGRLWLISEAEADTRSGIHRLGPEPFDASVDAAYLATALGKCRRTVKTCLLDQSVVAGIGNIYADEILFASGLDPRRIAASLRADEWARLSDAMPRVLKKAVEDNAITAEDYLAGRGIEYRNTPFFQVYGRAGEPCARCGSLLEKTVLAGRSSCFCPRCQT